MGKKRKLKLLPVQQQLSHPVCLCQAPLCPTATKGRVLQAEKVPDFSS